MNKFIEGLENEENKKYTENGAEAFKFTKSHLLDFFAISGALRTRESEEITSLFSKAYTENELLAMKALFYCRNIRGLGQGERRTPRIIYKYLATIYPTIVEKNFDNIVKYGRWDDLFSLVDTKLETKMWDYVLTQLEKDYKSETPSLLAKWMPSLGASSQFTKSLAKRFVKYITEKNKINKIISAENYSHVLKVLRRKLKVVETAMCSNQWNTIIYEGVPSKAMLNYKGAFKRHDENRFNEFISSVEKGEKKINSSTLFPYELVKPIISGNDFDQVIEEQWKALPNFVNEEHSAIVVADTSGSMDGLPLSIALSLAIYFAERNKGDFKDKFITFSNHPHYHVLTGKTLFERINNIDMCDWDSDTNLELVFDLVLKTAINGKLSQKDLPKTIIIVSDMEFDEATWANNNNKFGFYNKMKQKFESNGYTIPSLVFWNVNARQDTMHVCKDEQNTLLVSGSSPSLFQTILSGEIINPFELMLKTLNNPIFDSVTI